MFFETDGASVKPKPESSIRAFARHPLGVVFLISIPVGFFILAFGHILG